MQQYYSIVTKAPRVRHYMPASSAGSLQTLGSAVTPTIVYPQREEDDDEQDAFTEREDIDEIQLSYFIFIS